MGSSTAWKYTLGGSGWDETHDRLGYLASLVGGLLAVEVDGVDDDPSESVRVRLVGDVGHL